MTNLEKIFKVYPAFDKRAEGYGIHGVEFLLALKSPKGAVNFTIFTNRQLDTVCLESLERMLIEQQQLSQNDQQTILDYSNDFTEGKEFEELLDWEKFLNKLDYNNILTRPMGADLGYHSLEPSFDGHKPMENCYLLDGKSCYYDGTATGARSLYKKFLETNFDMNFIWKELEEFYNERIGE